MPDQTLPQIPPEELAERLDSGESLQVLDVRASDKVERGHIALGSELDFHAHPSSRILALPDLSTLQLDAARPIAVLCGHGNSSKKVTAFLRERGYEAYSVIGGMAAWETVYVARRLSPTPSLSHVIQLDRVGKGALSYILASDGEAEAHAYAAAQLRADAETSADDRDRAEGRERRVVVEQPLELGVRMRHHLVEDAGGGRVREGVESRTRERFGVAPLRRRHRNTSCS